MLYNSTLGNQERGCYREVVIERLNMLYNSTVGNQKVDVIGRLL